jgi:hypothetical protein
MKSWRSNSLDYMYQHYDACFACIATTIQCPLNMSFQELPHSQLRNMERFLYLQQYIGRMVMAITGCVE